MFLYVSFIIHHSSFAQRRIVTGQAVTPTGQPIDLATVQARGKATAVTDDKGQFRFSILFQNKPLTLEVRHVAHKPRRLTVYPGPSDTIKLGTIALEAKDQTLEEVAVEGQADRSLREASLTNIDPRAAKLLPSPFGDFNSILATLPGVVTASELSSQYSVRGGGYDENLIYVNDVEVYRPFLVRNGQQEGLSFVNPDMVAKAEFSAGGWQPRYGDKLSSVLNVTYRTPKRTGGSVSAGLLTQTAYFETVSKNKRLSYIGGIRRKDASYLFSKSFLTKGLPVNGQYKPRFLDYQHLLQYKLIEDRDAGPLRSLTVGWLTSLAQNLYRVTPEERQTDFGTLAAVLRLYVAFEGREQLSYTTGQNALRFQAHWAGGLRSDLTVSQVSTIELERNDVEGGYRLCDIETDPGKDAFNKCVTIRGVGTYYNFSRNRLEGQIQNILSRNYWQIDSSNTLEFGAGLAHEVLKDRLYEYTFVDSSDYVNVTPPLETANTLNSNRLTAYVQNTTTAGRSTITYGVRTQYWSLNKQFMVSPRAQFSTRFGQRDQWAFKAASGVYHQPAFYRELRNTDGTLMRTQKSQVSYHFIAGIDRALQIYGRPFRILVESYYKYLDRIVPYDVDNVRLRYLPSIKGKAYVVGTDVRFSGEFIKGSESWFSLGVLSTKEDIQGDSTNFNGVKKERGYIRRPTDQRVTIGIFFQDHLPNNPSAQVYLNTVIGTGLPFGPPNNLNYRAFFTGPFYRRVDIGFAKVISVGDKSKALGRYLNTVWLGLDVYNLIGFSNTNSYLWIKDVGNNQFAIPNYLSQRFFNLRVRVDF